MLGGSLHTVVATVVLGAGTLTVEAGLLERLKWFSWSECGSGIGRADLRDQWIKDLPLP